MRKTIALLGAGAIMVVPAVSMARPHAAERSAPTTLSATQTGQPSVECEDFGEDSAPGSSATAPGSAFNEEGTAHSHYAGEQPGINDKNPNSVSQYDVGCAHGIHPRPY